MKTLGLGLALTLSTLSSGVLAEELTCREHSERSDKEIQKSKERMVCPNLSEDAKSLLSSLRTLEEEFKKSPECQGVLDKVSTITKITTNKKWKELVNVFAATDPSSGNGAVGSLETSDIEKMSTDASAAAVALADTIALLSGSSQHCLPKDRASFLGSLSQVTKEVSTVVGSIASGPMGAGVSAVGHMISGAIAGIDKLFKSGKVYDFEKPAERLLFMNQFCAFTEIQQDINDYLNLDSKVSELRELRACYLEPKIKITTENCPECLGYEIAFRENLEATKIINRITEDAAIIGVEDLSLLNTTFSRCGEIHRAFYSQGSDLSQYVERLRNYRNEYISSSDRDMIRDFVGAIDHLRASETFPRYADCVSADSAVIRDVSIRFNNFIRDEVVGQHRKLFSQQLNTFRYLANRNYRKIPGQTLPGDSISKSMDIEKWAIEEEARVLAKLSEVNYRKGREEIMIQQNQLRDRITGKLMPHYLKYLFEDTDRRIEGFRRDLAKLLRSELRHYSKRTGKKLRSVTDLTEALKEDHVMAAEFVSAIDRAFRDYEIIAVRKEEVLRYCDYLAFSVNLIPKNRDLCRSGTEEMQRELDKAADSREIHETIISFNDWARKNLQLHSTYVMSYAQKMQDFLDTSGPGSPRWERRAE